MPDGFSMFVGALAVVFAVGLLCWGASLGSDSVRDKCEAYGKAKVTGGMLTCSFQK